MSLYVNVFFWSIFFNLILFHDPIEYIDIEFPFFLNK
jgi:hypothetical protein